jgi:hypothetical protein
VKLWTVNSGPWTACLDYSVHGRFGIWTVHLEHEQEADLFWKMDCGIEIWIGTICLWYLDCGNGGQTVVLNNGWLKYGSQTVVQTVDCGTFSLCIWNMD